MDASEYFNVQLLAIARDLSSTICTKCIASDGLQACKK